MSPTYTTKINNNLITCIVMWCSHLILSIIKKMFSYPFYFLFFIFIVIWHPNFKGLVFKDLISFSINQVAEPRF